MNRRKVVLTAAAFALLIIGSAATAQPQMPRITNDERPTPEQIEATPAAQRLKELLAVINSGDDKAMREFVEGFAPTPEEAKMAMGMPPLARVRDIYRRTRGLTLIGFNYAKDEFATATVRNQLTQGLEVLTVRAETKPPHRIISIPRVPAEPLPDPKAATATPPPADDAARVKEIESYVQRLADADVFSGVVLIAREGKPIFSKAYGFADRAKSVANTIDTPFLLGSMNKLFTSLAIGQLVEQGKLRYDDPLSKFIPDFPDAESAKKIRIEHLLTHTSGLGSYFNPRFFEAIDSVRDVKSTLAVAGREAPAFEPGSSWRYSNTGFLLLGRIIEIVTGKDYYEHMAANVFRPAGMTATGFPHYDRGKRTVALPYEAQPNGNELLEYVDQSAETPRRGGPAGGGASTAPDLLRLANALQAGKIVKPATYRLHAAAKPELSSPAYGYGFIRSGRVKGRDTSGHGGNAPGQCTEFNTIHDLPVPYTVIVLSNSSGNGCIPVYQKIVNTFAPVRAAAPASR
ncbi:MAG TPA: serine hydrolase domain-containing protein [Thermoanaerobaculia bacterium]|nr:serine hydrolase domain-containing protein [Thermoanaerobaculia bacterium]